MDQEKVQKVRAFLKGLRKMSDKKREDFRGTPEYIEGMELKEKIWEEWQYELSDEVFKQGSGDIAHPIKAGDRVKKLKKVQGSKEHPFNPAIHVGYHRKPWGLMSRVKRGKPLQSEVGESRPPVQVGETIEKLVEEEIPF